MKQQTTTTQQQQNVVRQQREELKEELAQHYANLPRTGAPRRRRVVLLILGIVGVCVLVLSLLIFWPAPSQTGVGGLPPGANAPDFSLPVYGGSGIGATITLKSLRGHPVVLNFWSESCLPCLSEVPYLQRVYSHNAAGGAFALLGINQSDPKDDIGLFGADYHITYPLLFDPGLAVNIAYDVSAIPQTFFIDSNGVVRFVVLQPLTPATMQQGLAAVGVTLKA